jgi:precorrin isomerase
MARLIADQLEQNEPQFSRIEQPTPPTAAPAAHPLIHWAVPPATEAETASTKIFTIGIAPTAGMALAAMTSAATMAASKFYHISSLFESFR